MARFQPTYFKGRKCLNAFSWYPEQNASANANAKITKTFFVCEHAIFNCMFGKKYNTLTHMVKVKTTTNTNLQVHVVFIVLLWHMSSSPLPPARVEVVETLEQQS